MITLEDVHKRQYASLPMFDGHRLVAARCLKDDPFPDGELLLKLECLQATGSFKARGAANKLLSLSDTEVQRGIVDGLRRGTTALPSPTSAGWGKPDPQCSCPTMLRRKR